MILEDGYLVRNNTDHLVSIIISGRQAMEY